MPKHLFTIPNGTVLPSPTGLPEGSPFVLESADATDQMYALRGTVWKLVGVGGDGDVAAEFYGIIPASTAAGTTICMTASPQQTSPPAYSAGTPTVFGVPHVVAFGVGASPGGGPVLSRARQVNASLSEAAPGGSLTFTIDKVTAGSFAAFTPLTNCLVIASGARTGAAALTYDQTVTGNNLTTGDVLTAFMTTGTGWAETVNTVYAKLTLYSGPTT